MFQRSLSLCILFVLLLTPLTEGVVARGEAVHSLDALPFAEIDGGVPEREMTPRDTHAERERQALLDDLDLITTLSEDQSISESRQESIAYIITPIDDIRLLLAEKQRFDRISTGTLMTPSFLVDPFRENATGSVIDAFLDGLSLSGSLGDIPIREELASLEVISGKRLQISRKGGKKSRVNGVKGSLSYEFSSGTLITSTSGSMISTDAIGLMPLATTKYEKARTKYDKTLRNKGTKKKGQTRSSPEGFEFGIVGEHLIFSKPVKIMIDTPQSSDGQMYDLMIMHEGDTDFHLGGLSVDPSTGCDTTGLATLPGSEAIVKGGKITFYTCGASSFTMNPTGGTAGSNDLRLIIGDCAQIQLYYNNLTQIYTGNPPATGCSGTPSVWPTLRIGATTYGNGFTAWTSATTTGSTNGNTYTATSTMRATVGGLNYDLIINWRHTAPDKYLTWSWRVVVPTGNTQNVRFYYGMDSFVAGADANDVGYLSSTGGQTIGIYDNVANVLSAFRYISGSLWTGYEAGPYGNINSRVTGGTDFNNTIQNTAGDLGYGVNWNFGTMVGTYSGTIEWRLLPFVTVPLPDLIPGIGQPEGPLAVGALSQMPITVQNAGNLSSTGVHTIVLTLPTNISGPTTTSIDSGWSCGAQVGTTVTCTKTTSVLAQTGNEIFRIPVIPGLAAGGTNVTFNVSLTNPGDSNTTNNTAFATNAVVGGAPALDPGGVGGEALWLQANNARTNCVTNGCSITGWTNIGGLGTAANGVTGLGIVTYDTINAFNGNPTLYFNNASLNTNNTLTINTAAASIFTVTRIGAGGAFFLGSQTGVAGSLDWTTTPTQDRLALFGGATMYSGANIRPASLPSITGFVRQTTGTSANTTDGRTVLTGTTPATVFAATNISIGRSNTINSTLASTAEVIAFPTAITPIQRSQVESYLAIKYGITLDQTTPTNYLGSNGVISWDATLAGLYKNNIAGIARDDTSTLNQNRSQSISNTGDIIVSRGVIGTNRQSFIWANDGSNTTIFTGSDSPVGYSRIPREWQFQEKNSDIGSVTLSYPTLSVPSGFTGTLMMLVDSDGVFASGATAYTGTLSGSNWDFSLNIADMEYITFARSVPIDTTPPVITSNSVASGALAPYGTFPITITYSDTGSAITPATLTGRIYSWNMTGATWDTTDIAPSYLTITTASTATGVFALSGLPFGRYRFDFLISDSFGNTALQSYTYYVDAIEWTVSAPSYDIADALLSATTFGTGELILTVRTVGAGFDLSMLRTTDLTYISEVIPVYSGSTGWGYDKDIGSGYSSTLTPHNTSQTLVSVAKNINTNGQKNTFTYRVKYGVNPNANNPAGDYSGDVRFGINLTY